MSQDEYAYRFENARYHIALGMVKMSQYWKPALAGVAILAAFLYGRCGGEPPAISPGVVDTVMVERPDPEPTIIERFTEVRVPVERTVVRAEVDTLIVREFVDAATDTTGTVPNVVLGKAFSYDGATLLLHGVRSDGAAVMRQYDVRPEFEGGWDADSTWIRESRLARFPKYKVAAGTAIVAGVIIALIVAK